MVVLAGSMFVIHLGQFGSTRCILSGPSRCLQVLYSRCYKSSSRAQNNILLQAFQSFNLDEPWRPGDRQVTGSGILSPRDVACDKP